MGATKLFSPSLSRIPPVVWVEFLQRYTSLIESAEKPTTSLYLVVKFNLVKFLVGLRIIMLW